MKIIHHESRRLIKVKVLYDGSRGWTLTWDRGKFKTFMGTPEEFSKVLKKVKAKDNFKSPNSFRSLTYLNIVKEIVNGTDSTIWIWEKDLKLI